MIFHPGIASLLLGSLFIVLLLCYAAWEGLQIVKYWDITSGSERQLAMERKTYLISTMVGYAMAFQLVSLFLFVYTADSISHLFVGAMCGAGSLGVNSFGYPTIVLKIISCVLAGLWLIVNYTDNRAYDYPLTRVKYLMLLGLVPFVLLEAASQAVYLLRLEPDLITSCCSVIFADSDKSLAGSLVGLPQPAVQLVLAVNVALVAVAGLVFIYRQRGAYLFAGLASGLFIVGLVAIISFISIYFYELPTHHCPFCILQGEYNYVGYPIYISLLIGGICGAGVGVLQPFRDSRSLAGVLATIQRRLTIISLVAYALFGVIVLTGIFFSNLQLSV